MRVSVRAVSLALAVAATASLVVAMPASAAITSTVVTTPSASPLYQTYNGDSPNTFAISGTTNSTAPATDKVDLRCFYGNPPAYRNVALGVSLAGDGSFSVPAASLVSVAFAECRLRAVPAGVTFQSNAYRGPLLLTSEYNTTKISGGPNDGKASSYYAWGQQPTAANDYVSLGVGGFWDSYLFDASYGLDTTVFFANAFLSFRNLDGTADTRSEVQIDGQDAYSPGSAASLFPRSAVCPPTCDGSQDNSGFPSLTYSFAQNSTTGDVTIQESDTFVRCPSGTAYPPTHATCSAFTSAGVKVDRIFKQDHGGHVVWISDFFSSTDGHEHTIDLLYENAQYLNASRQPNIGYLFPGQSGFAARTRGDALTVPKRPGSIYIKNIHADDGDPTTGQGAITYATAPTQILFVSPTTGIVSNFTAHYADKVPASGALTYKFGYSTERTTAGVVADSLEVLHSFTPCKVPKLKGKTVKQGKKALTTAYCKLGKVKKATSKTVRKGRIISTKPGAGVTKPFGTLVDVKVSKGP